LAPLAALIMVAMGPETRLAGAAGSDWSNAPQDPKDPRFSAEPAEMLQPARAAGANSVSPAATATSPAAVIPSAAVTIAQAATPAALPPALSPPPRPAAPERSGSGPALYPADASIDAHARGKTLYSFQADQLDVRAALALFARNNNLNIVPDNDVLGTVTVDLHDLPLEQVMRALLEAADCSWQEQGGLIRVRNTETRTFSVDYLRLARIGQGYTSALLASGSSGGVGGGGGGMGGGGMGGGMGGGTGGAGGSSGSTAFGGSSVNLIANNSIDFWRELRIELASLLTDRGRQSLAMNMTAGLVQVTDRPSALKKVERYLIGVDKSVHRQVDIETRLYTVTLNNQFQFGIDWVHVASAYGGTLGFGGSTLPVANGGSQLADSALGGISTLPNVGTANSTTPGNNLSTLVFQNFNTAAAVNALEQQGEVEVISKPRVRTLNNQTALIRVGEDVPFFNTSTTYQQQSPGVTTPLQQTLVTSITIGTILSLTPQISDDDWISLDISPMLTSLLGTVTAPTGNGSSSSSSGSSGTTAPDMLTKQASSLVRVRDGNTVVLGGLIQTQIARQVNKIPLLGDIPVLGKLFTGTFDSKQKQELVIFVTPHIVRENESSARFPSEDGTNAFRLVKP
jgi:MSHA type pilus biogenesis protein MshL